MTLVVTREQRDASAITKDEWREYTKTVWSIANISDSGHPAVFPPELPRRLVKMFSFVDETVIDPFGGTGTTGRVAAELGRRGICIDQNDVYVERMRQEKLLLGEAGDLFEPRHGDARKLDLADDSVGLAVTSPPYWNKADYGGKRSDIGTSESYTDFLVELRLVFAECTRVLRPGRKLCVVTANVNQMTDHGLLTFPLSTDIGVMLRDLGLVMINEIIWSKDGTGGRWGSANGQRPIFGSYPYPPNFLFKNVHEYVIVFAKPALTRSKGAKVRRYDELMGRQPDLIAAE